MMPWATIVLLALAVPGDCGRAGGPLLDAGVDVHGQLGLEGSRRSASVTKNGFTIYYDTSQRNARFWRDSYATWEPDTFAVFQRFQKGKVVLDVGCGSGILSLFAAKAGARLVIGVDASDILQSARKVVEANGMQDRIVLVQSTLETLDLAPLLPEGVEKVDVIISEWMGYLLLYESMLPSVLFARDKWLAPGGHLLPSSCEMRISASSHDRLGFWGEVYGYDMSPIREAARKETLADAAVELVPAASLLSPSSAFRSVHMAQAQDAELDFTTDFALAASTAGTLRCFAVHFDTLFDLQPAGGQTSSFSTAPDCPPTHWKQVALYLETPRELQAADRMSGSISCARRKDNKRAYDVSLTFAINGTACGTQLWRVC